MSRSNAEADCVIRTDAELFGALVTGKANAMAGLLRGVIGMEGDPNVLGLFRRVLAPSPTRDEERAS